LAASAVIENSSNSPVGREPVEHPHALNVRVWLMYGKFDELAKPYFM